MPCSVSTVSLPIRLEATRGTWIIQAEIITRPEKWMLHQYHLEEQQRNIFVVPVIAHHELVQYNKQYQVGTSMALHNPLPMFTGIQVTILGFGSNCSGIKQYFSPQKCHCSCTLWKPLIPADSYKVKNDDIRVMIDIKSY